MTVTAKAFSSTKSAYGDTYVYAATTDLFSDTTATATLIPSWRALRCRATGPRLV